MWIIRKAVRGLHILGFRSSRPYGTLGSIWEVLVMDMLVLEACKDSEGLGP